MDLTSIVAEHAGYDILYISDGVMILTLLAPMESFIKFDTDKSGRSFAYIEGPQVIISNKDIVFLSLKQTVKTLQKCRIMPKYQNTRFPFRGSSHNRG